MVQHVKYIHVSTPLPTGPVLQNRGNIWTFMGSPSFAATKLAKPNFFCVSPRCRMKCVSNLNNSALLYTQPKYQNTVHSKTGLKPGGVACWSSSVLFHSTSHWPKMATTETSTSCPSRNPFYTPNIQNAASAVSAVVMAAFQMEEAQGDGVLIFFVFLWVQHSLEESITHGSSASQPLLYE